jgi:hypothetical protein
MLNGYVFIYFILLPIFSLNIIDEHAVLSNFVLQNPPPFSRVARTAEKAVPIKKLTDKAQKFEELLSTQGIEEYYNNAIYQYQLEYLGSPNSKETNFIENVYPNLTEDAKNIVKSTYFDLFGEELSENHYYGVSYALSYGNDESYVYLDVLNKEKDFNEIYQHNLDVAETFQKELDQYQVNLANYEYQVALDQYQADMDVFLTNLEDHLTLKVAALKGETDYDVPFTKERPTLTASKPSNFTQGDTSNPPLDPKDSMSQEVIDAVDYVDLYKNKIDVTSLLEELGQDFVNHRGLLAWYTESLDQGLDFNPQHSDISDIIVSFKQNYDNISTDINDKELEDKLYVAMMSIRAYDVFSQWLDFTTNNIDNVPLDEIQLNENRCTTIDPSAVTEYNFSSDAMDIVKTLFDGESISWIILQFKYDYEAGVFDDYFEGFPEVSKVLVSTKDLVDEYDLHYKDIATSIEGNIPMLAKIGISVMKYHVDVYDTLQKTPILDAAFNDAARLCTSLQRVPGYDVMICDGTNESTGLLGGITNLRYLIAEVYLKAYFMVDDNNNRIVYDSDQMEKYLDDLNKAVENNLVSKEVTTAIADQFAFHVIDDNTGMTLLEQMYRDGYISIDAMRILSNDEHDLFSEEFRLRVSGLIR